MAPFHASDEGQESVYHDTTMCPYGREIIRHHSETLGIDGRRRCEWCVRHASVAPFHSTAGTDDPVFHDLSACPFGQEITRRGSDNAGRGGGRRCEWCAHHAQHSRELESLEP